MKIYSLPIVVFFALIKLSDGKISCLHCQIDPYDNITSDLAEHLDYCKMQESEQCYGAFSISYTNETQQIYPSFVGQPIWVSELENPQDSFYEQLKIVFDKFDVQRNTMIQCSDFSNCSIHHVRIFQKKLSTFLPMVLWKTLSDLLYSSTYPAADLKCLDSSGQSIACPNGVCLVNMVCSDHRIMSSCFQSKSSPEPHLLDVWQFLPDSLNLKFSCNKPLCNSKETTRQVLEILAAANITNESIININKI